MPALESRASKLVPGFQIPQIAVFLMSQSALDRNERTWWMGGLFDQFLSTPDSERQYLEVIPPEPGWIQGLRALGWVVVPVIMGGRKLFEILQRSGLPPVAAVAHDVTSSLNFPLGPVESGILYKRHPYDEICYLPAANYNPYIFKEKVAELARVLISAGATSFQITADSARTTEMALDAAAMVVDASIKAERKSATKVVFSFTGTGENTGTLPGGLLWLDYEKDWQTIWDAAVHRGAKSVKLEIFQDVEHELRATLADKFSQAGFNLGGGFRGTASSRMKVEASFSTEPRVA
jgi:hypothetical protein